MGSFFVPMHHFLQEGLLIAVDVEWFPGFSNLFVGIPIIGEFDETVAIAVDEADRDAFVHFGRFYLETESGTLGSFLPDLLF